MKGTLGCETLGEQLQGCGKEGHDATWAQGVMVSLQGWAGCFPYLPGLQGSGHLGGHQSRMSVPVPTSRSQPQRSRRQAFRWLTRAHSPLPRSDRLPAWPSLSSAPPGAGGGWMGGCCALVGAGGRASPLPGWDGGAPLPSAEQPLHILGPLVSTCTEGGRARDAHSPLSRGFWGSLHRLHRSRKTIYSHFQLPAAQVGRAGGMAGARRREAE